MMSMLSRIKRANTAIDYYSRTPAPTDTTRPHTVAGRLQATPFSARDTPTTSQKILEKTEMSSEQPFRYKLNTLYTNKCEVKTTIMFIITRTCC